MLDSNTPFFERMHPGYFLSYACVMGDDFSYNVQPSWSPKEDMPHVLQRGVVLPHYPNKKHIGGVERPISGSCYPNAADPFHACLVDGSDPPALPLAKAGAGGGEGEKQENPMPLSNKEMQEMSNK